MGDIQSIGTQCMRFDGSQILWNQRHFCIRNPVSHLVWAMIKSIFWTEYCYSTCKKGDCAMTNRPVAIAFVSRRRVSIDELKTELAQLWITRPCSVAQFFDKLIPYHQRIRHYAKTVRLNDFQLTPFWTWYVLNDHYRQLQTDEFSTFNFEKRFQ